MTPEDFKHEEKLKRFLYTCSYHGGYVTGNPDKYFCKTFDSILFQWVKSSPDDFIKILTTVNDDPLLVRRANLFYIMAEVLHFKELSEETETKLKETIFKLVKSDQDFFDFVKYYTIANQKNKHKINTSLRKMILKFYKSKQTKELAETVTKQERYHGWSHKDLIRLCHFKCDNVLSEPIVKYVLFGVKQLPESGDKENKTIIEYLKKSHELRTTTDVSKSVALIKELHASISQVNSKLNKNEEVWSAALDEMSTREILQCLYRFYKFGFFKSGGNFQIKVIEALKNEEKIKKCNLHPLEVFAYLKFFEKGGKPVDSKLLEYLQKKEIKEETLKKITTPSEPKCKPVIQSINKCLMISYSNVQPTGKKFMVTIDVTDKLEDTCFRNRRISCLEAAVAIIRFLSMIEKNVTVAVFKDSQVNFVDISKFHSAIEKLKEHKSEYIVPSAPIDWARNKKKPIDVFINFMSCNWMSAVPQEVRDKMEKLPDALNKYSKKMGAPDTRVVKFFLGGVSGAFAGNGRNILSISGFSVEVPKVLEAFCRGNFS